MYMNCGLKKNKWQERFFTVKKNRLVWYSDKSRAKEKGCLCLNNCNVKVKKKRWKKKFEFGVSHAKFGTKEFYVSSSSEMYEWMKLLSERIHAAQEEKSREGWLKKLGGIRGDTWQKRWIVVSGGELVYFDDLTGHPSGILELNGAHVKEKVIGSEKNCFEVLAKKEGKTTKHEFSCRSSVECAAWIRALTRQIELLGRASASPKNGDSDESDTTYNPMNRKSESRGSETRMSLFGGSRSSSAGSRMSILGGRASFTDRRSSGGRSPGSLSIDTEIKDDAEEEEESAVNTMLRVTEMVEITQGVSRMPLPIQVPSPRQGFMDQKSPAVHSRWQKRYLEVRALDGRNEARIYYYKGNKSKGRDLKGVIDMIDVRRDSIRTTKDDCVIEFMVEKAGQKDRSFTFRADSATEATQWVESIREWRRWQDDQVETLGQQESRRGGRLRR